MPEPLTAPLADEKRRELLGYLVKEHIGFFPGSFADQIKLHEMWCMRIGPDDEWLLDLYRRTQA